MVSALDYTETGYSYLQKGQFSEAAACFEAVLLVDPTNVEAWVHRGIALHKLGNFFDAVMQYDKAIEINPGRADPWCNKGGSLYSLGVACLQHLKYEDASKRFNEAMTCYEKTVALDPRMPEAWQNIGNLHKTRGDIRSAMAFYERACMLRPGYVDAELCLSICELETGYWDTAWDRYEVRWKSGQIFPRGLSIPQWEGEDLNGKSLFVYAEQGHGDNIQFCRLITEVKRRYPQATVDLEVRLPLRRLMMSLEGPEKVIVCGERVGAYDYACPMLSLCRVLKLRPDGIPAESRYLSVGRDQIETWARRIDNDFAPYNRKLKIGICWAGMARHGNVGAIEIDKRRSTSLAWWAPLGAVEDVVYVSLQKDSPMREVANPPPGMLVSCFSEGMSDGFDDFADTAALIENLDLVISVDTAVAHLAAALGKPTWMLSRFDGCWRWMGDREDSPWYPTLRQFRQKRPGDWGEVMTRVATQLKAVVAGAPLLPWWNAAQAA